MEWQPIETAPKDGTWIMGFCPRKTYEDQWQVCRFETYGLDGLEGWNNAADNMEFENEFPTHWKPLDKPTTK